MATGCVKIVKRAKEFDEHTGKFIPEEKRAKSVDLFKGRITLMLAVSKWAIWGMERKVCGQEINTKMSRLYFVDYRQLFQKSLKQC